MNLKLSVQALVCAAAIAALVGASAALGTQRRAGPQRGQAARTLGAGAQRNPADRPARRARAGEPVSGDAEPGRPEPRGRGAVLARALREIGVTADQRRQLRAIRGRNDDQVRGIGRRLVANQRELMTALNGPSPDLERGRALARQRAGLVAERERARTEVEIQVFKALTPEQRARMRQMRQARADARPAGRRPVARRPGRAPRDDGDRPEAPIRQVGLSREQVVKVRELRRRRGPVIRDLNAKLRETQRAIDDALLAPAVDEPTARRLADQLGKLEGERAIQRFEAEAELRAVLTPEQLRRLVEARRRFRAYAAPPAPAAGAEPEADGPEGDAAPRLDTPPDPVL